MNYKARMISRPKGLSLMEVLFAIGVLMVGLLGIAAVLPVGSKNASSALRIDAATSAIENQVSNATARFQGPPAIVDVPVPSQNGFGAPFSAAPPPPADTGILLGGLWTNHETPVGTEILDPMRISTGGQRYQRVSTSAVSSAFPNYDPAGNFAPYSLPFQFPAPNVTTAFCVDPAFLAASSNLRPDAGAVGSRNINHYDRTKFPCYDINYSPFVAPSLQMDPSLAWPMTPRMLRVAASAPGSVVPVPNDAVAEILFSERDGLPLTRPKDRTLPPSLFFRQVGALVTQTNAQRSGEYSSVVMFAPTNAAATNYEVSVVVYESRELTQFNTSTLVEEFPLTPYTSSVWPLAKNTNYVPQTYADEVMGIVTDTEGVIREGVGRFTFIQSNTCNPDIKVGQWLMLSRLGSGVNDYGWYRVSSVLTAARDPIGSDRNVSSVTVPVYVTEVEVRGKDWIFHPLMIDITNPATLLPYPDFNLGSTLQQFNTKRNATIVIKAPQVVSVSSFTL